MVPQMEECMLSTKLEQAGREHSPVYERSACLLEKTVP